MASTPADWLDGQSERLLGAQTAAAETARLIVIFSTGVTAALLVAALQVADDVDGLLWVAIALCAATVALAVHVVMQDRLRLPNHVAVLEDHAARQGDADDLLSDLRVAAMTAVRSNEPVVSAMKSWSLRQLAVAMASWATTLVWLLLRAAT